MADIAPQPSRPPLASAFYTCNTPVLNDGWTEEYFDKTLKDLEAASAFVGSGAHPSPRLIVWPESPAPFYVPDPRFRQSLAELATKQQAYVLAGSLGIDRPEGKETAVLNSAVMVEPNGSMGLRYDKIHLVPFGEYVPFKRLFSFAGKLTKEVGDFSAGRERTVFDLDGHKVAVFICYEAVFPDEVRLFPKRGAEVLVNISNDGWFDGTEEHEHGDHPTPHHQYRYTSGNSTAHSAQTKYQ